MKSIVGRSKIRDFRAVSAQGLAPHQKVRKRSGLFYSIENTLGYQLAS